VAVDVLGMSYREAAHALRTREATITSRLFRARKQVAERLLPAAPAPQAASDDSATQPAPPQPATGPAPTQSASAEASRAREEKDARGVLGDGAIT
jgi:hypothetical protein